MKGKTLEKQSISAFKEHEANALLKAIKIT